MGNNYSQVHLSKLQQKGNVKEYKKIFHFYDKNNSNYLNQKQTRHFLKAIYKFLKFNPESMEDTLDSWTEYFGKSESERLYWEEAKTALFLVTGQLRQENVEKRLTTMSSGFISLEDVLLGNDVWVNHVNDPEFDWKLEAMVLWERSSEVFASFKDDLVEKFYVEGEKRAYSWDKYAVKERRKWCDLFSQDQYHRYNTKFMEPSNEVKYPVPKFDDMFWKNTFRSCVIFTTCFFNLQLRGNHRKEEHTERVKIKFFPSNVIGRMLFIYEYMTVEHAGQYEDQQKFSTWRCGEADLDYWPNIRLSTIFKVSVPRESHDDSHWDPHGLYQFVVVHTTFAPIIPSLTFDNVKKSLFDSEESDNFDSDDESASFMKVPITPRV